VNSHELKDEIAKAGPPVGVSAITAFGVNLADWVYILTVIYLIVQIVYLLYKFYRRCRPGREE